MSEPAPTGVIHDIGYRHYDGARHGRGYTIRALMLHSLRGVFGLGRTARSKIIPFVLFGVMMLPAVVSIATMALLQRNMITYSDYAIMMQVLLAIFVASQSPYLVAPDLRFRILPLYLSRPVTPRDYVAAKLGAMSIALAMLIAIPITAVFIGELVIDMPGPPNTSGYVGSMVSAVVYAVLLASLGVTISSFTPRRGLGVASVIGFYLLTSAVSGVLTGVLLSMSRDDEAAWAQLLNPFFLVNSAQTWITGESGAGLTPYPDGLGGPVSALAVLVLIVLSVTAMLARYRKAASA
ncbi:ABC-2 type transport system permease protein [Sinosporangium album]|uniref:ABC-2 type transport system permease protein n=1 Tax=Sinosporangium album TaxID=504805 RepID=A0A1G8D274_9ACTN|nr:ABC transporter permease subunit [Sinosporangium album]SDH51865.1 ABC-2 type transport system permease protein [Sinosporangium album]